MNSYCKAALLGLAAGTRSMLSPALVSRLLAKSPPPEVTESPLAFLAAPTAATVFTALAVGELIGDKLPMIPSRLDAGPLGGRLVTGGLSGAAICLADGKSAIAGLLLGGTCAVAGAFAGYHLRRQAGQRSGLPDPWIALVEDAVAIGLCFAALSGDAKAAEK